MSDDLTTQKPRNSESLEEILEKLRNDPQEARTAIGDLRAFNVKLDSAECIDRNLSTRRRLQYQAMSSVLGNIKDVSKLKQVTVDELLSLVANCRLEYLELLFAAIADLEAEDPSIKAQWDDAVWGNTLRGRDILGREEGAIHDLYRLQRLLQAPGCGLLKVWTSTMLPDVNQLNQPEFMEIEASLHGTRLDRLGPEHPHPMPFSVAWIHVPSLNGPLLLAISRTVSRILVEKHDKDIDVVSFFLENFRSPAITSQDPFLTYRDPIYKSLEIEELNVSVVVFPCLELETVGRLEQRRKEYKEMRHSFFPEGKDVPRDWVGIYLDRTLDEAYYPGLDGNSLKYRNGDQVISREYGRTWRRNPTDLPVLMVSQLWLWKMDNVLLSAHSTTHYAHSTTQSTHSTHSAHSTTHYPDCEINVVAKFGNSLSIDLQIGCIIASHIENFGRRYVEEKAGTRIDYPPTLDMFETAVCSILLDVDKYRKQPLLDIKKEGDFIHSIADIRSELYMIQTILKQQKEVLDKLLKDPLAETEYSEKKGWDIVKQQKEVLDKLLKDPLAETEYSREGRVGGMVQKQKEWLDIFFASPVTRTQYSRERTSWDIIKQQKSMLDELLHNSSAEIIQDWGGEFKQQTEMLDKLLKDHLAKTDDIRETEVWDIVRQARERLDEYDERTKKIDRDAERIQGTIDAMLNLKWTGASMRVAMDSIIIGYAALGFAIVTIIFTPLSFITSLYALPIDQLIEHQKNGTTSDAKVYEFRYIQGVLVGAAFATVLGTLAIVLIPLVASKFWARIREILKLVALRVWEIAKLLVWGIVELLVKMRVIRKGQHDAKAKKSPEPNGKGVTEAKAKPTASRWGFRRRPRGQQKPQTAEP